MTVYDKPDKPNKGEGQRHMSRKKLFIAHPSAESAPTVEIGQQNFGRRLQQILDQKGMNYSDLARLVWGKTTTKSGYEVAKNRDRISVYIAGKAFPDPRNLKKIADTLGVEIADLAPEHVGDAMIDQQNPTYSITKVQGESDQVFLRVNKLVPEQVAAKIMFLLATNYDVLIENAVGQTLVVEAKTAEPKTENRKKQPK
jgi:transcriptional regulator with XRE-family HTH domain